MAYLSAQTFTREEQAYIKNARSVSLGFIPDRAPYSYIAEDGSPAGVSVDIMKLISQMSGLSFTYEIMPPQAKTVEYLAENADTLVVGVLADNPLLQTSQYCMSEPFFSDSVSLAALRTRNFDGPIFETSYTVVIPRTYVALEEYIKKQYPSFHIIYCSKISEGLGLVLRGKADFMAQNMTTLLHELQQPKYYRLCLLPSIFMDERMGIVGNSSADTSRVMDIINKCLAAMDKTVVSEIVLENTIAVSYRVHFTDVLYLYRIEIIIAAAFLIIFVFLFISHLYQKDHYYSEIADMNTKLTFAMEQASEAAMAKSRFLLRISHDIRTPMNAIAGSADLMEIMERRNDATLQDRLETIERIRTATFSMEKLVDDVINRATFLEGPLELHEEEFELESRIKAACDELQMVVSGRVNWISSKVESDLDITVSGDAGRLSELMELLVEWIVCQQYPLRSLFLSARGHSLDEGRIFTQITVSLVSAHPIDMLEENDSRRLQITNLVDVLGGAVSFELHNEICIDVSVTIPFALPGYGSNYDRQSDSDAMTELMSFHGSRPLRILVVDDNEVNVLLARNILKVCGIQSDAVYNGRDGCTKFESSAPGTYQAILMDIRMPVMNGNDATRAIRRSNHPDGHTIPIYAFSANYASSDIAASINAGVNGYLRKPLEVQKLVQMLNAL